MGARLRDPDTVEKMLSDNQKNGESLNDMQEIDFIDENYNGVDHEFIANYYSRFVFDNAVNIILVLILLNML